jgi:hypothetical protein
VASKEDRFAYKPAIVKESIVKEEEEEEKQKSSTGASPSKRM